MKKKLLSLALMTIFISLMALGSAAFFTKDAYTTNIITTGTVSLLLDEHLAEDQWTAKVEQVGEQEVIVAYAFNDPVMPGVKVEKKPTIKNNGSQPFFLRAKVEKKVVAADKVTVKDAGVVLIECLDGWQLNEDGWWYYTKAEVSDIVHPGEEITLFNGVMLKPETGNEYQNCTVTISVRAQAVQSKNQTDGQGKAILDAPAAMGWPAE